MNETIKRAIRQRARHARSSEDLVQAIFETFEAAEINLRDVSLEDMKSAIIEAARAARRSESATNPMPV